MQGEKRNCAVLEELQERQHVWDAASEGQRDLNEAREKGMGLMVQGLEDCGIASGLDFSVAQSDEHPLERDAFWLLCGKQIDPGQMGRQGDQQSSCSHPCRPRGGTGDEENWAETRHVSFPPWSGEDGRRPTLQSILLV